MSETTDIFVKLGVALTGFAEATAAMTRELEALALALAGVFGAEGELARLTTAGRLVFDVALYLGFYPLDVLEWLETCPGALVQDFGDGYRASAQQEDVW